MWLTPALNIHRSPLCGRNFEYYSEDPFVSGKMASAMVAGIQSQNIVATPKHFACNNKETNREESDSIVSERALREIYLKGFEICVKEAKPLNIMTSYNKINGVYASENTYTLTDILRGEWQFDGFVMTDWWAEEDPIRMQIAGNDMLMPGTQLQIDTLIAAVKGGRLDEKILDRNLLNILRIIKRTPSFRKQAGQTIPTYDKDSLLTAHAQLARQVASKGMVLLKNDYTLPLRNRMRSSIALLGKGSYDTYVGGTGSGCVTRPYKIVLSDALTQAGYMLDTALQNQYTQHINHSRSVQPAESAWYMPYVSELTYTPAQLNQMAATNDMAILTIQRMAGEGGDRQLIKGDYYLTDEEENLIINASKAFHKQGKKLILVLNIGSPIELTNIVDYADAILLAWLPGQEAGNAIVDVLTGITPPMGKLPMPFYYDYQDAPSATNFPLSDGDPNKVCYREGMNQPQRTLYPLGYGLTYP